MQKSLFPDKFRILSGSALKLIAVISMLLDHSALVLARVMPVLSEPLLPFLSEEPSLYFLLRKLGRLAFPIYCFLIGEGLAHTKNRRGYLLRLLIFALLSELPFNLMLSGKLFYPGGQNVFFTLLLGALLICIYESGQKEWKKAIFLLAMLLLAKLLDADYGVAGAVLIPVIYLFRSHPALQAMVSYPLLSCDIAAFAAFLPVNLYNGQRGFIRGKALKYAFYAFYPVHMLLLVLVWYLLIR